MHTLYVEILSTVDCFDASYELFNNVLLKSPHVTESQSSNWQLSMRLSSPQSTQSVEQKTLINTNIQRL